MGSEMCIRDSSYLDVIAIAGANAPTSATCGPWPTDWFAAYGGTRLESQAFPSETGANSSERLCA